MKVVDVVIRVASPFEPHRHLRAGLAEANEEAPDGARRGAWLPTSVRCVFYRSIRVEDPLAGSWGV